MIRTSNDLTIKPGWDEWKDGEDKDRNIFATLAGGRQFRRDSKCCQFTDTGSCTSDGCSAYCGLAVCTSELQRSYR